MKSNLAIYSKMFSFHENIIVNVQPFLDLMFTIASMKNCMEV